MWQEYIQWREKYLRQADAQTEVHREYVRNLFLYETLQLAGHPLPEGEFQDILRSDKRPHQPEALRAYDLWHAWLYTSEKAAQHAPFNTDLIRTIASHVMKHTGREITTTIGRYAPSLGDYRLGEDYNAVYPIAAYDKIPDLLISLCRKVNVQLQEHSIVRLLKTAIYYLFEFAHIKPFGDGNIETGLLSTNYILLYHRQPLLLLFSEDRAQLLNAIKTKDISQTPEEFENFILEQQVKFFKTQV